MRPAVLSSPHTHSCIGLCCMVLCLIFWGSTANSYAQQPTQTKKDMGSTPQTIQLNTSTVQAIPASTQQPTQTKKDPSTTPSAPQRILVWAVVEDGDTIPCITLKPVNVFGFKDNISAKERRRRTKLINNIIKVYPYARMAAERLEEYDRMLAQIPSQEGRSKAMKKVEKSIVKEFTPTIEELTFSQGLILLKLVDRETGKTTYKIVDELRGKMRAFFYQSIARLWHYNLKDRYDPNGKDKEIEVIVRKIERGDISI